MIKKKAKAIVGLVLVASMFIGCGETAEESITTEVLVETQKAQAGNLALVSGFVGTIEAAESVNIIPMAAGTVTETFAEVGDMVEAGDVLFKIDDDAAQLQKKQAELTLKSTKQNADITTNTTAINNYASVYNAQATIDISKIGYKTVKRNLNDARDAVDDLEDTIDDMETLKGQYNAYVAAYDAGVAAGDDPTNSASNAGKAKDALVGLAGVLGTSVDGSRASFGKIGNTIDATIGQLESGLEEAEKGVDALKDTKATTEIQLKQAQQALQTICELQAATGGQVLADQLQTGISLAAVGVESANLALSYYDVTTPISGKIISKNISTNDIAAQGMVAYVVAQDETMSTSFNVSEDVKNTLFVGKEITVERNGKEYKGTISEIANSVDAMTGLFEVKAEVDANGEMLPNGVNVKINCETYSENNAIIIPYDCVYYDGDGSYVYLNVDGKAVKTFVTPGIFDDENIAILEGIKAGDEVVTSWASNLADGCDLKVAGETNKEVEEDAN